jgi:hypothetical protein
VVADWGLSCLALSRNVKRSTKSHCADPVHSGQRGPGRWLTAFGTRPRFLGDSVLVASRLGTGSRLLVTIAAATERVLVTPQLDDRRARAVGELPAVYAEAIRLRVTLRALARRLGVDPAILCRPLSDAAADPLRHGYRPAPGRGVGERVLAEP